MNERIECLKNRICLRGQEIITYDELSAWPSDEIQSLEEQGYIWQIDDADGIVCTECDEHCYHCVSTRKIPGTDRLVGTFLCGNDDTGGIIEIDLKRLQQWQINKKKLLGEPIKLKENEQQTLPKKRKKRPTRKEFSDRNRSVALAAAEFKIKHDRLPTVDEIIDKTNYDRKQIYQTDAYKEGKIARKTTKATSETTGKSVNSSEYYGEKSVEHTRAKNRSKAEQAELDARIDEQQNDDNSRYAI